MSAPRTNIPAANVGSSQHRFVNRNLNSILKAPATPRPAGTSGRGSLLVISGSKPRVIKSVGVAAAPTPLNTPSLRRENKGKDVTVNLVPIGSSSVWGQTSSESKGPESAPGEEQQTQSSTPTQRSSAPWTKSTSEGNDTETQQIPKVPIRDWADVDSEEDEEEEKNETVKTSYTKPSSLQTSPIVPSPTQPQHPPTQMSLLQPQYRGGDTEPRSAREGSWRSESRPDTSQKDKEPSWRELRPQPTPAVLSPREMFPSSNLASNATTSSLSERLSSSMTSSQSPSTMGEGFNRRAFFQQDFRGDNRGDNRFNRDEGTSYMPPSGGPYQSRSYDNRDNRDRDTRRGFSQFDQQDNRRGYPSQQDHNAGPSYQREGGRYFNRQQSPHHQSYQGGFQQNSHRYEPRGNSQDSRQDYHRHSARVAMSMSSSSPRDERERERDPPSVAGEWRSSASSVSATSTGSTSAAVSVPPMDAEQLAEQKALETARQERELLEQRKKLQEQRQREQERMELLRQEEQRLEEAKRAQEEALREQQRQEEEQAKERQLLDEERQREIIRQEESRRFNDTGRNRPYQRQDERAGGRGGFREDRDRDRDTSHSEGQWTRRPVQPHTWEERGENVFSDKQLERDVVGQHKESDELSSDWRSQPLQSSQSRGQSRSTNQSEGQKTYASLFPTPNPVLGGDAESEEVSDRADDARDTRSLSSHESYGQRPQYQQYKSGPKQQSRWSRNEDQSQNWHERARQNDRRQQDGSGRPENEGERGGDPEDPPTTGIKAHIPHVLSRHENASRRMLYDPKTDRLVKPSTVEDTQGIAVENKKKMSKRRLDNDGDSASPVKAFYKKDNAQSNPWRKNLNVPEHVEDGADSSRSKEKEKENMEYEEAVKRRREESRKDMEEARDRHLKARQQESDARKEARTKERVERPPRTKGVLFRFTDTGELEQVLSSAEVQERAAKREQYLESQRVMMEKLAQRDQERKEREAQRRVEKADRTEKVDKREKVSREPRNRREAREKEEKVSDTELTTVPHSVGSPKRRGKSSTTPVIDTTDAAFIDSEFDYDAVFDEFGELNIINLEFTEVKNRRVKKLEKKVQRDRDASESSVSSRVVKLDKKSRERSRKEGGDGKDDGKSHSDVDSKPAAASVPLPPARPAWNDPQATLEVLGVLPPPSLSDSIDPEPESAKSGREDKVDRRGKGKKDRDREKKDTSDRKKVKKTILDGVSSRVSTTALRSALSQSPVPTSHSQAQSVPVQLVQTESPTIQASSETIQPSLPTEDIEQEKEQKQNRFCNDDETNMDIQSMALEASVTRRDPMSYPTFIPGVGLSTIEMPGDRWQQPQLQDDENKAGYGMLLQMPLQEDELPDSVAWQDRQHQQGDDLNLYNTTNSELTVGSWSLGGFTDFMQPMTSGTSSWNYEQSYQTNDADGEIYRAATFLGQGNSNVNVGTHVGTQWGGQFNSDGSSLKDSEDENGNTFLGLGGSSVPYSNFGYGMSDIGMAGAGDMRIETTPMTRDINSLLMVDSKPEDAEEEEYEEENAEEKNEGGNVSVKDDSSRGRNRGRGRGGRRGTRSGRGAATTGRSSGDVTGSSSTKSRNRETSRSSRGRGNKEGESRGYSSHSQSRVPSDTQSMSQKSRTVEPVSRAQESSKSAPSSRSVDEPKKERSTRLRRRPDLEGDEIPTSSGGGNEDRARRGRVSGPTRGRGRGRENEDETTRSRGGRGRGSTRTTGNPRESDVREEGDQSNRGSVASRALADIRGRKGIVRGPPARSTAPSGLSPSSNKESSI